MDYMFLGGIVLGDADGTPYAAGTPVSDPVISPNDVAGIYVLIDPDTKEPYKIESN